MRLVICHCRPENEGGGHTSTTHGMFFAWLELEVSGTSHWRNNSRNLSFSVSQLKATLAPHQLRALGEKVGGGDLAAITLTPCGVKLHPRIPSMVDISWRRLD